MRWILGALVMFAPQGALADAIDGPPACPPGAVGRSSHSGQWCVAAACAADADCTDGARCAERRLCTIDVEIPPGGLYDPRNPPHPMPARLVVATCGPTERCTGTDEPWPPTAGPTEGRTPSCAVARVCVPPTLPALSELLGAAPPPVAPPPAAPAPTPAAAASASTAESSGCAVGGSSTFGLGLFLVALVLAAARGRR